YDILGREVISTPAEFDAYNQCNLSTSQLRQGIYFVILRDSNEKLVFNEKLIKK
ncbi:MAG: hypothetical protein ACI9RM_001512, partial [Ulvibacter sp.]